MNCLATDALLTDLYELTMAYAYWKAGKAEQEAVFHLSFRRQPFQGGFTLCAGLADSVRYLSKITFSPSDLGYLKTVKGADGKRLFTAAFLEYLRSMKLRLDVDALPEGTVVFPQEPLVRVSGPILQAQLVETAMLNFFNFQSLVATKAARLCHAAQGDPVIEFGLRRAQGVDGGFTAARAAYIGGCVATSNVAAGKAFNIPVAGTHAHSWVMSFEDELSAFKAYASALPGNCILLVDTYNSLEGVNRALEVAKQLRREGHRFGGIRLDSGDLAYLSVEARKMMDRAGFKDAAVVASNDLDEHLIASLKQQKAAINVWGVGTRLVTAHPDAALGGVYKLSALKRADGSWEPKIKLSEQVAKITNPGILQVRRFRKRGELAGDAIYDQTRPLPECVTVIDPVDPTRRKRLGPGMSWEDLLVPVFRKGSQVYTVPDLKSARERAAKQLAMLHPGIKRFENPHRYPAGLEQSVHELKMKLVLRARGEE